jgi:hypothetical protein
MSKNNRTAAVENARANRLAFRDEDPYEIRKIFRKSFKPHAKAANRKGRRAVRRQLRTEV